MDTRYVDICGKQVRVETETKYFVNNKVFYTEKAVEEHLTRDWAYRLLKLELQMAYNHTAHHHQSDKETIMHLVDMGLLNVHDVIAKLKPYRGKDEPV